MDYFWYFNQFLSTQYVNVARFARNFECDFFWRFSNTASALEMTPLKMSTSAKILRKNAKKFLIKGVVRKNQVQEQS